MSRRNANRANPLPHVRTHPPLTRAQSGAGASESSAAAPSAPSSTSASAADEDAPLPGGAGSGAGTNKGNLTAEMLGVTKGEIKTAVQLLFVESSGGEGVCMSDATDEALWFAHPGRLICEVLAIDVSNHNVEDVMAYFNHVIGRSMRGTVSKSFRIRKRHFARNGDENTLFEVGSLQRHFKMQVQSELLRVSTTYQRDQKAAKGCAQRVAGRAKLADDPARARLPLTPAKKPNWTTPPRRVLKASSLYHCPCVHHVMHVHAMRTTISLRAAP